MLGKLISDPHGIEGVPRTVEGLGLLDVETEFGTEKTLTRVGGTLANSGASFEGYEMHVGKTAGPDTSRPMLIFADGRSGGATSPNGRIAGCYVHGLFASDAARSAFLETFGAQSSGISYEAEIDDILDRFAAHLAKHIAIDNLLSLAG
jgi:adenosylcobyric acid synthase